jgi:hypothetical protein
LGVDTLVVATSHLNMLARARAMTVKHLLGLLRSSEANGYGDPPVAFEHIGSSYGSTPEEINDLRVVKAGPGGPPTASAVLLRQ